MTENQDTNATKAEQAEEQCLRNVRERFRKTFVNKTETGWRTSDDAPDQTSFRELPVINSYLV